MSAHLNYCRQFLQWIDRMESRGWHDNRVRSLMVWFAARVRASQKIILPDGGWCTGDSEARALVGSQFRLPFQNTAFEFKRAGVGAKQIMVGQEQDDSTFVGSLWYLPSVDEWHFAGANVAHTPILSVDGKPQLNILRWMFGHGLDVNRSVFDREAETAICVVMDALNALACRNVGLTPSRFNRAASKAKGALSFDDYHVLTIIPAKGTTGGAGAASFDHRSPREHLRRGHIRRMESGPVWVNATVVNAGKGGTLHKDYRIGRAS